MFLYFWRKQTLFIKDIVLHLVTSKKIKRQQIQNLHHNSLVVKDIDFLVTQVDLGFNHLIALTIKRLIT